MSEQEPFTLAQWFDLIKPITKEQVEEALEQMSFDAVRDGLPVRAKAWKQAYLWAAVKVHNARFHP